MTRRKRIALELLGPPLLGAALVVLLQGGAALGEVVMKDGSWQSILPILSMVPIVVLFAYAMTMIQSILYTVVMEWRFARGLDPRSWNSVGLSSLLGFASGAAICMAYGFERSDLRFLWLFYAGIGLVVGILLGLLIKVLSPKEPTVTKNRP